MTDYETRIRRAADDARVGPRVAADLRALLADLDAARAERDALWALLAKIQDVDGLPLALYCEIDDALREKP